MAHRVRCSGPRAVPARRLGAIASWWARAFPGEVRTVERSEPVFPPEALHAGATRGRVTARMTLSSEGEVIRVEVLEASPQRLFDRAVVRTLSLWRFEPGAQGRCVEVDVVFGP